MLARNYALKLENDDYKGKDKAQAMIDFMNRVHAYEKVYETIVDSEDDGNISYIKLINVGQKVITRNCTEYLASQVTSLPPLSSIDASYAAYRWHSICKTCTSSHEGNLCAWQYVVL